LRRQAIAGLLGGVILAQGALAEEPSGDAEAGRAKAGICRTCHGLNGYAKMPLAPHIGGENALYIENQLHAFHDGTRVNEMMSVVAAGLDDEAIADLAAWYASQQIEASLPPGTAADRAPEACVDCHGANGVAVIEEAPNLAGENATYIRQQLEAFRAGRRASDVMQPIAAAMDDAAMREAADWYASINLEIAPAP